MSGFIEEDNRYQSTLFPERVDECVDEDSVARVVDVFVDRLDISGRGFKAQAADTGRPGFHPRAMKSRGEGIVGYHVQTAVDVDSHLIVVHDVTNIGIDRRQLSPMASKVKAVLEVV